MGWGVGCQIDHPLDSFDFKFLLFDQLLKVFVQLFFVR